MKPTASTKSRKSSLKGRPGAPLAEDRRGHRNAVRQASQSTKKVPLLLEHFPTPDAKRVSFGAYFPAAREVLLAGSFNDWQPWATPLQNQGDGRWVVELELGHGRHEYRFVVDGDWTDDPMAPAYTVNSFGTLNCVLLVV